MDMTKALCRKSDTNIFFDPRRYEAAKAFCQSCTIVDACLATAMSKPENYGVWGGTTHEERQALKREIAGVDDLRRGPNPQEHECGETKTLNAEASGTVTCQIEAGHTGWHSAFSTATGWTSWPGCAGNVPA